MHKSSVVFAAAALAALVPQCLPQVLSPPEILDPKMSALQLKHMAELKAAAVEITSHQYPFRFYLSRTLDLTEQQEQQTDQRSIRFADFQGSTVLQITGNYFAAYPEESMPRNERVKETWLNVVLPILRATAPRLGQETQLNAFAIEVSHHVRGKMLGVKAEHAENLALIVPRAVAEKIAVSNNVDEQVTALLDSRVFIDGKPVTLWPSTESAAVAAEGTAAGIALPASIAKTAIAVPTPPAPAPPPVRDLSPDALRKQQAAYQETIDRMLRDLNADAHFVSYAPPVLIPFHGGSWLQLSVSTNLAPSDAGSQYRIAALAFDRHIAHLIRPILAMFPKNPDFDGIVFSSTVRIPGKTAESVLSQSVEFFLPVSELRRYADYDLTGQQLINSGLVLINGERVGLELQSAEADIH